MTPAEQSETRAGPSRAEVKDQIRAIMASNFDWIGPGALAAAEDSTRLRDDLDLDSLHLVSLQVAVEDHFGVAFDPADPQLADAFDSMASLTDYVHYLVCEGA